MKWLGEPPNRCDFCRKAIVGCFIDGATKSGPWAFMCQECHKLFGVGFGTGRGQMYQFSSGTYIKVER